jgi:tetratricopeptide (TPR) repeat protein
MSNLANVLRIQGQLDESLKLQKEALASQKRVLGPDHGETLGSMYNVALILSLQGKFAESFRMKEEVLEKRRRALGPKHPDTLASLNELSWRLATVADAKFRDPPRALQLAKELIQQTPKRADYWNTLGVAYYRAGDWKNAIAALAKSEELAPGEFVAANNFFLAMAYWQLGDKDQGRKSFETAVKWMQKNQSADQELLESRAEASTLLGVSSPKSSVKP